MPDDSPYPLSHEPSERGDRYESTYQLAAPTDAGTLSVRPAPARYMMLVARAGTAGGLRLAARRPLQTLLLVLLVILIIFVNIHLYRAGEAVFDLTRQIYALQSYTEEGNLPLSQSDATRIGSAFTSIEHDLTQLDQALSLPFGGSALLERTPILGPRYQAGRELLRASAVLADAGEDSAAIGREALAALDQTGITYVAESDGTTWLDVVSQRQAEFDQIRDQIEQARQMRATVDDDLFPWVMGDQIDRFDELLSTADQSLNSDLPALEAALGAEQPVRYLVLMQNPAELRPSGGFAGTMALVTVERGQVRDYQFFESIYLTVDYMHRRDAKLPQPWPIQRYFPQDGFLLHDANWYADFPRSGKQIMEMYAESGWRPIDGVIAIDPAVVGDLLQVTGPITLAVDGLDITFDSENVHEQIEQQRLRQFNEMSTTHKELVGMLGQEIAERLKMADRQALGLAGQLMRAAADRRDLQFYSANPDVEAMLDHYGWSGRLIPDPDTPTLAVTFANVALGKSSQLMHPQLHLTLGPVAGEMRQVTARFDLTHTGSPEVHEFYAGHQIWCIDVTLPNGSRLLRADRWPMPDPETPNGGSYVVELDAQQSGSLTVEFMMPAEQQLLLRRQPGLTTMQVSVVDSRCGTPWQAALSEDLTLDLPKLCP